MLRSTDETLEQVRLAGCPVDASFIIVANDSKSQNEVSREFLILLDSCRELFSACYPIAFSLGKD